MAIENPPATDSPSPPPSLPKAPKKEDRQRHGLTPSRDSMRYTIQHGRFRPDPQMGAERGTLGLSRLFHYDRRGGGLTSEPRKHISSTSGHGQKGEVRCVCLDSAAHFTLPYMRKGDRAG